MKISMDKAPEAQVSSAITEGLLKLKKDQPKDGVDLLSISKKLSDKKFGKKR